MLGGPEKGQFWHPKKAISATHHPPLEIADLVPPMLVGGCRVGPKVWAPHRQYSEGKGWPKWPDRTPNTNGTKSAIFSRGRWVAGRAGPGRAGSGRNGNGKSATDPLPNAPRNKIRRSGKPLTPIYAVIGLFQFSIILPDVEKNPHVPAYVQASGLRRKRRILIRCGEADSRHKKPRGGHRAEKREVGRSWCFGDTV